MSVAQRMYEAYLESSGGLTWDGKPCPTWDGLSDAVRRHWAAAAVEAEACLDQATAPIDTRVADMLARVRQYFATMREAFDGVPHSREKSLALTKLDELEMWTDRAIRGGQG